MKGIKKALSYITNVEYAIMVVTFVAMVIAYFISVVNRNFIKASMPWTEEVAMYSNDLYGTFRNRSWSS